MTDLGALGGAYSQAYAINEAGAVTGQAYLSGGSEAHAFSYRHGEMTDLGALHSYSSGLAINNAGVIVGDADVNNSTGYLVYHAAIWTNGKIRDLNASVTNGEGWLLTTATGINDAGQIVGSGTFHNVQRASLLNPE